MVLVQKKEVYLERFKGMAQSAPTQKITLLFAHLIIIYNDYEESSFIFIVREHHACNHLISFKSLFPPGLVPPDSPHPGMDL